MNSFPLTKRRRIIARRILDVLLIALIAALVIAVIWLAAPRCPDTYRLQAGNVLLAGCR